MLIEFISPDFSFKDDRGSLTQLVHQGWSQVNFITSVAGAFRGGHYHKLNKEAFFIISGKVRLVLENMITCEKAEYTISSGDFFIIHPNVKHSFEFIQDTILISMYQPGVELVDGAKDILR